MGSDLDALRLDGRSALVIGGGRGVGGAACAALAAAGAAVMVADRSVEFGTGSVSRIVTGGGEAAFQEVDVLDDAAVEATVEATVEAFGRIDILVNAAGGSYHTADGHNSFMDQSSETWDLLLQMNLRYAVTAIKAAVPHMRERGGAIVNVSSTSARSAPFESAYGAAKAGLENLTKTLAFELGPIGIRANAVAPGPIATDRLVDLGMDPTDMDALFTDMLPLQRVARPEDIANVILFLASDLSSLVTGTTIPVEGGLTTFAPELRTLIESQWKKP